MNIFVYSDESGVFDVKNNDYYVYGGVIFLNKKMRDNQNIKYTNIEREIVKENENYKNRELKANILRNKDKSRLFKSARNIIKFAVIINQKKVHKKIFVDKKDKQRYLDYAYKIGLKDCFKKLISENKINEQDVENISIFVDEHTTASNGKYEFKDGLIREFKKGTFNQEYNKFYEPIFKQLKNLEVKHCNSEKIPMIRLADITANYIYNTVVSSKDLDKLREKIYIKELP